MADAEKVVILAQKGQSIPGAAMGNYGPDQELKHSGKYSNVHGGSLVDFGNGLTQRNFAPHCGQTCCFSTVGAAFESSNPSSRYLTTASRFLRLAAMMP